MKADVLLINPWITDFAAYDFWLKPLGLLYIGSVLRQHGYQVALIDCMDRYDPDLLNYEGRSIPRNRYYSTGKFFREIIEKPHFYKDVPRNYARYGLPLELFRLKLGNLSEPPKVVLITSGMTYWYPGVQMVIREIRGFLPQVPIVLGGIYATLCREHAVETSGADFVISGEGELAALKIVDNLTGRHRNYDDFPTHLDGLPRPLFECYGNPAYATIMTSRGCPLKCSFCASAIVAGVYRWRSTLKVVEELEYYCHNMKITEFAFYDDALLTNHKNHLEKILDEVISRNWKVTFHTPNGLQCKMLDEHIAQQMFRAGFKTIRLSYESGNPDRQRDMSNKVNNDLFSRAVKNLYQAGYGRGDLDAYVMMALPGQAIAEVLWSMAFVHAQGVKIRLAAFSPIPGTVEWTRAVYDYAFAENVDPLFTNNTIVPIKPEGTTYHTFERINLLAKRLNGEIRSGRIHNNVRVLAQELQSHFKNTEQCEFSYPNA